MSHTKEPWTVDAVMSEAMHDIILDYHAPDGGFPTVVASAHGYDDEFPSLREGEANARRIVACVNALAGIANPAALPDLLEAVATLCNGHMRDADENIYAVRCLFAKLKGGA